MISDYEQVELFALTEEHQPQPQPKAVPAAISGIIQRGLDELEAKDDWIERTSSLKFKKVGATDGDV